MTQLTIKPHELPIAFAVIILIALIASGYLDTHQWLLWIIIIAIPAWIILGRNQKRPAPDYPHQ